MMIGEEICGHIERSRVLPASGEILQLVGRCPVHKFGNPGRRFQAGCRADSDAVEFPAILSDLDLCGGRVVAGGGAEGVTGLAAGLKTSSVEP